MSPVGPAEAEPEQLSLFEGRDHDRYRQAVAACSDEDRAAWRELSRWVRAERPENHPLT